MPNWKRQAITFELLGLGPSAWRPAHVHTLVFLCHVGANALYSRFAACLGRHKGFRPALSTLWIVLLMALLVTITSFVLISSNFALLPNLCKSEFILMCVRWGGTFCQTGFYPSLGHWYVQKFPKAYFKALGPSRSSDLGNQVAVQLWAWAYLTKLGDVTWRSWSLGESFCMYFW